MDCKVPQAPRAHLDLHSHRVLQECQELKVHRDLLDHSDHWGHQVKLDLLDLLEH